MIFGFRHPLLTAGLCLLAIGGSRAFALDRYSVRWADGSSSTAAEVEAWGSAEAEPRIAGRKLYSAENPAQLLRDNTLTIEAMPPAYVEFVGGDLLPGKVTGLAEASATDPRTVLAVEPGLKLDLPGMPARARVHISADATRRIVWRSVSERLRPGMLFFQDGRQLAFRSLQWRAGGVRVLVESGPQSVTLEELAEIHLPASDPWEDYYTELAALDPSGTSRLVRVETPERLRATTSLERFAARSVGDAGNPEHWYHAFQPAWSRDAFFVAHRHLFECRFSSPVQVPLTRQRPSQSRHRGTFSEGWTEWCADANVQGGPLVSAGETYGWGFGVHASHDLEFVLPALARRFRTQLGLDQAAGSGGCAQGRVYFGDARQAPAYESDLLIGSAAMRDTGWLNMPEHGGKIRLTLVADAAEDRTPEGADPWDIRDVFDWLEPTLELDSARLRAEVARLAPSVLGDLASWEFDGPYGSAWRLANTFDTGAGAAPRFELALVPLDGPLTISKRFEIGSESKVLVLKLGQFAGVDSSARLKIRVDGRRLAELPLPVWRDGKRGPPIAVRLDGYNGRSVDLELELIAASEKCRIGWLGSEQSAEVPKDVTDVTNRREEE